MHRSARIVRVLLSLVQHTPNRTGVGHRFEDLCTSATVEEFDRRFEGLRRDLEQCRVGLGAVFVKYILSMPLHEQMLLFHHGNTLGKTTQQGAEVRVCRTLVARELQPGFTESVVLCQYPTNSFAEYQLPAVEGRGAVRRPSALYPSRCEPCFPPVQFLLVLLLLYLLLSIMSLVLC